MANEQKDERVRAVARIPRELHKELKLLAVRRETTVQSLLERYVVDGFEKDRRRDSRAA